MKYIYTILIGCSISFMLSACYDLDKLPEGTLTTSNALSTIPEMQGYLNQFYDNSVRTQPGYVASGSGIAYGDQFSDNMVNTSPLSRTAGNLSLSDAAKLENYNHIRTANFMINNLGNCKDRDAAYAQCVGEVYYFRAWHYFQLLKNYGGVTWINQVLPPDHEVLKKARDSRVLITDSILADLDRSISQLSEVSDNSRMRVHRDVARALKSEVALFEATWEKYHKAKGNDFYTKDISDNKIRNYLEQARDAAKEIIDRNIWSIQQGDPKTSYRDLFITLDLSANKEVLWWKKYDASDNIGHSVTRFQNVGGGQTGISLSLVDEYLTKKGKLFIGAERDQAQKVYGAELSPELRDPRLSQTVATPGAQMKPDGTQFSFPPLQLATYHQNSTGFSMIKYVEYNTSFTASVDGEFKSQAPAIQYRYAEILLNYAEALAELDGAGNADKIILALNPLRQRVGMPAVDFDREYNTSPAYPFSRLNKYIQVVRRERRIELACEGKRFSDILRWAAAEELICKQYPLGALFVGSTLEKENEKGGFYNKMLIFDQQSGNNLYLTGNPGDSKRYINPYKTQLKDGLGFNPKRDYLLPIQQRMLSLTDNLWQQNPGWN